MVSDKAESQQQPSAELSQKLENAQATTHYKIDGKEVARIRYGEEADDFGAGVGPCHDCGAVKGQFHIVGCDVERCPKCAGQAITCDCAYEISENSFDSQTHREKAVNEYLLRRPHYEQFSQVAKNIIEEALSKRGTKVHSVQARAKEPNSFGNKAAKASEANPSKPMYPHPLSDITDLAGIRVITFFPNAISEVDKVIADEFQVLERSDKGEKLIAEERFGYSSVHYLVRLNDNRTGLLEYAKYKDTILEIQVRTILQHAWAEIEHDIQYKSASVIPVEIRRRFTSLAGMLEVTDREFQAVQDEDQRLRSHARQQIKSGNIDNVEITPDALKAFLTRKFGSDFRIAYFSYDFLARILRKLGFQTLRQLEDCTEGYNDDRLSRLAYGFRQGQVIRCELVILASMGEKYIERHPWAADDWFRDRQTKIIETFKENGVAIGTYDPLRPGL